MTDVKPQRLEYVQQTRDAVLRAAEQLFIERGYQATSLDAVGATARFTKGAVYRHFKDKQTLFEAVFAQVATDTMTTLIAEVGQAEGPDELWRFAIDAMTKYLEASATDRYRRIVLEEGPAALGWSRWRELDRQYAGRLLDQLVEQVMTEGLLARRPVEPLSRLCCAAIGEGALMVAEADDPEQTLRELVDLLTAMLSGLRA
ncbi:TetR/AcrR family transcriptional regulator [Pseudonocardia spinosispora]|uniref:TetR/AcrR family transcriptional regulator n=1 Tax=Pseudonocardia spinosispora TaxID=103441 RepID=UPI000685B8F4|nr:TetR/AcrR family transcriptional regulator [Pseudonocardia spinosispora]